VLSVREMESDEVEEIILTEYDRFGYSVFADLSQTDYRKKVIVAECGEILGFVILYWNENGIHIGNIFIREEYRGRGLGKILLKRAIAESLRLGFRKIYANVSVSSEALEFYLKNGFKIEEKIKHYYGIYKHAFKLSKSF